MTKLLSLEKLDHTQTKDRIASLLRQEILSGRIKDGEHLLQEQIAEMLGVSRMPIREAFQILESEGLLLRLPNRHIQVVGLNKNTIQDNLQFIASIETQIIFILLDHGKNLSVLQSGDEDQFHQHLANLLDNTYISQIYSRLINGYPQFIKKNFPDKNNKLQNSYKLLLKAIECTDKIKIQQHVRDYYRSLANLFIDHLKKAEKHE